MTALVNAVRGLLQDASVGVFQKDIDQRPQELWLVDRPEDLANASERLINLLRSVLPAGISAGQNFWLISW